jgi:regulator of protease activity HflC (stomatin/prohibitin superfamily)
MIGYIILGVVVLIAIFGCRIVRPTNEMLVETLGKYTRTDKQGFTWVIPGIQQTIYVNITERMVDVEPQMVITKDNLNAVVDAIVYYKIKDSYASQYNVSDHESQLTALTRTTLRAVIGKMTFSEANEGREKINIDVEKILDKETATYGVDILRVELQKIEAPSIVQQAMNDVVVAERKKIAATNFANAVEIEADGQKRSEVKKAEGIKQAVILKAEGEKSASILKAEGEAQAFELINKSFKGGSVELKRLEVTQASLQNNTKVVLTEKGISPSIIMDAIPITSKDR